MAVLLTVCGTGSWRIVRADDITVSPLPQAHVHNNYLHERPLLDALVHDFTSVEADVFRSTGTCGWRTPK